MSPSGLYVEPAIYSDEGIFDFPSERESNAHLVSIDRNAARIYRIRAAVLTSRHPEAISIYIQ